MNRYSLTVVLSLLLCISCSDYRDNDWQPGDAIYQTAPSGRIHGDERSQQERFSDCIAGSKGNGAKALCCTFPHHRSQLSRHYLTAALLATRQQHAALHMMGIRKLVE